MHQQRLAHVLRLITQDFTRHGVFERCRVAKDPVGFLPLRRFIDQHGVALAARIGAVTAGQQDAALLRGHNARRQRETVLVHDHRFGQKGFDQMTFERRQGVAGQQLNAGAWRHAHGVQRRAIGR